MRARDSPVALTGSGAAANSSRASGAVRSSKASNAAGEALPQRAPQPQQVPMPVPDQGLMGAGEELDRLGQVAVPGDRTVRRAVQADQLGQHVRVTGVALGA
jgi:hypothetical protein